MNDTARESATKAHGQTSQDGCGVAHTASSTSTKNWWPADYKCGVGTDTIMTGIERSWTLNPVRWDMGFFDVLLGYDWRLGKEPGGARQWFPEKIRQARRRQTALAETYVCDDDEPTFLKAVVAVWHKVMMADRFDLRMAVNLP